MHWFGGSLGKRVPFVEKILGSASCFSNKEYLTFFWISVLSQPKRNRSNMTPSPDKVYPQWTNISMMEMVESGMLVKSKNAEGKVVYVQSKTFKTQANKSLEKIYRCKLTMRI